MPYSEGIIRNTEFLTTAELAEKLKMNVQVITRKVQAGEILAYKIGKDWRIPEQSVYDWLERNSNRRNGKTATSKDAAERHGTGRKLVLPERKSRRMFLLEYILAQFEPSRSYSEDEVNKTIARYHSDYDTIRREFLAENMMGRTNGAYTRTTGYRFSE